MQFLSFVLVVVMIVISATVGSVEAESSELDLNEGDVEAQAALTGLYAMSIILVFMFLAKFLFDLLFIYGVITVSGNEITTLLPTIHSS